MTKRATIEALAAWLSEKDDFVLLGHISPDGDAVGTCLGVCHALKALGKRAVVAVPGGIPRMYANLPGAGWVFDTADALPFEPRTAFSIDVSDMGRLGEEGRALFEACPSRCMLDHHATNEGFGEIWHVDGKAAAVGEIAVELIDALGVELTREMAECLYVAISTDCGNFNYSNTRGRTMRAAARCVDAGIDVAEITQRLYRTRSLGRTRLLGIVLSGLEISDDGTMAWARLTLDMLRRAGAIPEDNEGIVNYLLEIEGVEFAMLVEERAEGTKLSLRSKRFLNVATEIAVPLGGGGHNCAAGALVRMSMEEAEARALEMAVAALARAQGEGV